MGQPPFFALGTCISPSVLRLGYTCDAPNECDIDTITLHRSTQVLAWVSSEHDPNPSLSMLCHLRRFAAFSVSDGPTCRSACQACCLQPRDTLSMQQYCLITPSMMAYFDSCM
ncbi:hypothetical protein BAUCODRAFT_362189 [Baudoinia panamericana UAMH 10762]|uniref:Uncharacterized protein n=1 Tax=Baudoinia panamericana (strain UAMH 10762) TaxID=717646 RepID=M2NKR7_BAUPA|nr:uncharacterized protein BAUCODRAFT_362189 [Baudoinia panamericana UAMH 10762]EMD00035.1 hypothetical protein BAUCODRAFT_362189 [Baudoinia panamericana UAMH 10762]